DVEVLRATVVGADGNACGVAALVRRQELSPDVEVTRVHREEEPEPPHLATTRFVGDTEPLSDRACFDWPDAERTEVERTPHPTEDHGAVPLAECRTGPAELWTGQADWLVGEERLPIPLHDRTRSVSGASAAHVPDYETNPGQ